MDEKSLSLLFSEGRVRGYIVCFRIVKSHKFYGIFIVLIMSY